MTSIDYADVLRTLPKEAFVYLDPPYDPASDTANFTGYARGSFSREDQIALRAACDELDARGIKFMLSNSLRDRFYKRAVRVLQHYRCSGKTRRN
jgi:DNA adenine methylase